MNLVIIILEAILVMLFLLAGFFKIFQTKERIFANGGRWAEDIVSVNIKIIGVFEVVLAISLLVSLIASMSPIVTMLSSVGMGIIMIGAIALHTKRKEYPMIALTIILSTMAFFIACQSYYMM